MSTDAMKKPAGDGNPTAGDTDRQNVAHAPPGDKEFSTLRAMAAMRGHQLHRSNPTDGPVAYWATRWGIARELPTIEDVRAFVRQIGGEP